MDLANRAATLRAAESLFNALPAGDVVTVRAALDHQVEAIMAAQRNGDTSIAGFARGIGIDTSSDALIGSLDEVMIWRVARSAQELCKSAAAC